MSFCSVSRLTCKLICDPAHGVMNRTLWYPESGPKPPVLLPPVETEPTMEDMATQTFIKLTDDLDGSDAVKTVGFALDGVNYEIDLSGANVAKMEKELDKYVSAARRVSGRTGSSRGRRTRTSVTADPRAIRAWAASNGVEVNARGRISADVVKQFEAANA